MKVYMDQTNTQRNVDRATTAYRNTQMTRTGQTGDYALDISGTVMDNNAYTGHGKTAEEVMQDAGQIDVATQRDYMTVMSNTMSEEDFGRLQEEGCQPGDMEIREVVTIVDQIKAELLKGGTQVVGYTDDLDAETLREITGSEAFAQELKKQFAQHDIPMTQENVSAAVQAYRQACGLTTPDDGTVKYMVENQMEPTIDNLYKAGYSSLADSSAQGHGYYSDGAGGYYAKKAEEFDWEQLQPQMEKVIEKAGLQADETTLEEAKWLIEMGVPLTAESIGALHELRQLSLPQSDEETLRAITAAISDGKSAYAANLADPTSSLEKAVAYEQAFAQISEEAVDKAAEDTEPVTLRTLEQAQKEIEQKPAQPEERNSSGEEQNTEEQQNTATARQITARRQLEEIRLRMTVETNLRLLRKGIAIDTTELTKLVDALRALEEEQNAVRWKETEPAQAAAKESLFQETRQKLSQLPYLPAAILGKYISEDTLFSIDSVYESGTALRNSYEAASESYETLMTAPRADMGDSIRKAFRNVDDILRDMNLELSDENRKAVRILGYNSMEITESNIVAVKEKDIALQETIRKMTPQATLQAIRDGINPLTVSMEELNSYLDSSQQENTAKEEKFSKYLYKLEKNKEILPEEREAYIGIYRMFRQLEKADDAAIGSLVRQGSELSFENLLTAMRSSRRKGMDYTVDDHFAGVDGVKMNSITDQITAGFTKYDSALAGAIADSLEPEMLTQMELYPEMTMEQFAQELEQAQTDEQLEQAYRQEQLKTFTQMQDTEQTVIKELLDYGQPVTADNLTAMSLLRGDGASMYRKLNHLTDSADKNISKEKSDAFLEHLNDKEEAVDAYEEMQEAFVQLTEEAQDAEGVIYVDLKALQSVRKQLRLAGSLAKEENYQIPVEIDGELTAVNLKILHGAEGGKVSVSMQTDNYGEIAAQFGVRAGILSGYMASETSEGTQMLQDRLEQWKQELGEEFPARTGSAEKEQLQIGDISVIKSREIRTEGYQTKDLEHNTEIETADLYRIAKSFIRTIAA